MTLARRQAVLLVNPFSPRARRRGWLDGVRTALDADFALEIRIPDGAREMASAASDASIGGAIVIAAGGDGTANLVANAIAAARGTMGIIPLGTANDLARELGIPDDPREAARRLVLGTAHQADLVAVNGRRFLTVGGLGIVSDTTLGAARWRAGPLGALARAAGPAVYKLAATAALLRHPHQVARIRWNDRDAGAERTMDADLHGIFVTNHARCGGGLVIPTGARGDDGRFELALVSRSSRAALLGNFTRLSLGRRLAPGAIDVVRTDHATVETETDAHFVADGELLATGRRFTVVAEPRIIGLIR